MKELFQYGNSLPLHLGNISRNNALLCLKVKSKIEEILNKSLAHSNLECSKFLLAVSGGVDSIAMLGVFIALQQKYKINFQVVHFNHGIRAESKEEKKLVQDICNKFQIDFYYQEENVPIFAKNNRLGLEEAGRILRYKFFESVRIDNKCDYICTAHHADDLAEDVLMRIIRGTAISALGGMKDFCLERKIIRPFLEIKKDELQLFVDEICFPYAFDISNEDNQFLRNRVRNILIPLFLQENPNFINMIQHLHQSVERDNDYFMIQIQNFFSEHCKIFQEENKIICISIKSLQKIHKSLRFRIYAQIISKEFNSFSNFGNMEKLDQAIMHGKNNFILKFTNNLRVKIVNNELNFFVKILN